MSFSLSAISQLTDAPFDEIVDVRSPAEFAEDRVAGAISLPVLSNEERARVGTIYKQDSPFSARKLGAGIISRNIARHLERHFADKPGSYRPLVYCWRGGQRSGAMGVILQQIGWRAETLEGGYRSWRRLVTRRLYDTAVPAPVVLLDGNTGTAKTDILSRMAKLGHQVIDLEGLAGHRGSTFGAMPGGQPAQKGFESALAVAIDRLDPAQPVIIEAESSKVGARAVPPMLWQAMMAAPRIRLSAPLQARAVYLALAYRDIAANAAFASQLERLQGFHSRETMRRWQDLHAAGDWQALAGELMAIHYDPRYEKQRERASGETGEQIALPDLSVCSLDSAAEAVAVAARKLAGLS